MTKIHYFIYGLLIAACIVACARPAAPGGGPVDKRPPRIVPAESSKNYSTRFTDREITITFDEFINVKNTSKEVNISPPMLNRPTIKSKGKKLTLTFNELEPLREDATYTINFGKSIADFRANNVLENFRFVFSTGDYIDSLSIRGSVTDVLTQKPAENTIVMLYDNLDDSIIYKERPFYFTSVEKDGSFTLENLKSDTFQVFALKDLNANYYYDQEAESLAFIDSSFVLTDSSSLTFKLDISDPKTPLILKEKIDKTRGELFLIMNQSAEEASFKFLQAVDYQQVVVKDSLKVWYQTTDSLLQYVVASDTASIDLAKTKAPKKDRKIQLRETPNDRVSAALAPSQFTTLRFSLPLAGYNGDSISLLDTAGVATAISQLSIDTLDNTKLLIKGKWKSNQKYQLDFLPGALEDYFGNSNRDTISSDIYISESVKFGTIVLNYKDLDSTVYYLTTLTDKRKNETVRAFSGDTSQVVRYELMNPSDYTLTILLDTNNNGSWDAADYNTKAKAEKIITKELEAIRADWELEVEVKL